MYSYYIVYLLLFQTLAKMEKSVKIKTWFTQEEALKFSTFLVETDEDANMVRCRGPKSTNRPKSSK